jgi:hypothetical protein
VKYRNGQIIEKRSWLINPPTPHPLPSHARARHRRGDGERKADLRQGL